MNPRDCKQCGEPIPIGSRRRLVCGTECARLRKNELNLHLYHANRDRARARKTLNIRYPDKESAKRRHRERAASS